MAELKPCPFCGGEAILHYSEYPAKSCQHKKEIPKGARLVRSVKYPSGSVWYEYRQKAFVPKCMDTKCLGRLNRLFETKAEAIEGWNRRYEPHHDLEFDYEAED